jgi:hypothetical protein
VFPLSRPTFDDGASGDVTRESKIGPTIKLLLAGRVVSSHLGDVRSQLDGTIARVIEWRDRNAGSRRVLAADRARRGDRDPAALVAALFLALVHQLEDWLWDDLPDALWYSSPPWFLVVGLPVAGALIVVAARRSCPVTAGTHRSRG